MEHCKKPEKFGFELLVPFCFDVLVIQPDLLTQCITLRLHFYGVSLLLEVLSMQKVLPTNVYQLFQFYSQSFSWERSVACVILVFKKNMQMIATVELKRYMTCTGVLGVFVGKLCHWEEPCPVILLSIHKSKKISFYVAVLLLHLTVCLRMECSKESSLDAEEVTERRPKLGHKNRSLFTNDGVWEPMISYHHVYNYFC